MFNKLKTISLADVTLRLHCSTWGKLWFHDSNDSLILCLAVEDKYNNSNISENNESIKLKLDISNVLYERRKMKLTVILLSQQSWFESLSASKQTLPFTSVEKNTKYSKCPWTYLNCFSIIYLLASIAWIPIQKLYAYQHFENYAKWYHAY